MGFPRGTVSLAATALLGDARQYAIQIFPRMVFTFHHDACNLSGVMNVDQWILIQQHQVGDMAPLVGIEASHLSQQLGVLRRAGLVSTRKEASSVFYAIRDPATVELLVVAKRILINSLAGSTELLAGLRSISAGR